MGGSEKRTESHKSLVGFVVGSVSYAVAIEQVREIVNPVPLTPVPHVPSAVAGVVDHRGEIVPIVDLRARFGLPKGEPVRRPKWILVEVEGRSVGLLVDRMTQVFSAKSEELRPPPELGEGALDRAILAVMNRDGALTFVLDLNRWSEITRAFSTSASLGTPEKAQEDERW